MDAEFYEKRVQTVCLLTLSIIAIAAALFWLRPVMIPFVLAVFFTLILTPLIDLQIKYFKLPRALAILSTLIIGIATLIGLWILVSTSMQQMAANADNYQAHLDSLLTETADKLQEKFSVDLKSLTTPFLKQLSTGVGGLVVGIINAVFGILKQGVLVLIFVLFLLLGKKKTDKPLSADFLEGQKRIERYITTKVAISALTGFLVWIILMAFGIDLALVFGLFAFILNFIPSVGSIISTLLPLPVILVTPNITPLVAILAIAIPGAIQFTIGNIIEPKIMGESLDLHPVVILMALIFWGMIWGIVGMLLAVPLTAIMKIIFQKIEMTRPLSNLMAGRLN